MQAELVSAGLQSPLQGGRSMTRRFSPWRTAAMILAGALIFALAGDRGLTAPALGIDPLEVLDLQVKPNVFVVLDTSGSMEDLTDNSASSYGGDDEARHLFHIGVTRAAHQLWLIVTGTRSPLITAVCLKGAAYSLARRGATGHRRALCPVVPRHWPDDCSRRAARQSSGDAQRS